MNQYVTGAVIKELREKNHFTQAELAEKLCVSDKTISKWETRKGYPDLSLLQPLSEVFGVSITELFSGCAVKNANVSANMMRSQFYVCPVCGNIIHSMGEAVIQCHGILLTPCLAEPADDRHRISVEIIEDEYFVQVDHAMTKDHYISFLAAISGDSMQYVKLYPEGSAEARFQIRGVKTLVFYCNRDGMFAVHVHPKKVMGKEN